MRETEEQELGAAIRRLNARVWGISMGVLLGGGIFLATVILVIKGGPDVGQHLGLLRAYFPGYRVTWPGSLVGLVYGFVVGYGAGRFVGAVYNRMARS